MSNYNFIVVNRSFNFDYLSATNCDYPILHRENNRIPYIYDKIKKCHEHQRLLFQILTVAIIDNKNTSNTLVINEHNGRYMRHSCMTNLLFITQNATQSLEEALNRMCCIYYEKQIAIDLLEKVK